MYNQIQGRMEFAFKIKIQNTFIRLLYLLYLDMYKIVQKMMNMRCEFSQMS